MNEPKGLDLLVKKYGDSSREILDIYKYETKIGITMLVDAVASSDYKNIGQAAHKIKGASRFVFAKEIEVLAQEIEYMAEKEERSKIKSKTSELVVSFEVFCQL